MITIPYNSAHLPGTWKELQDGDKASATFTCPNGHMGCLTSHEIKPDGTIHPSVVCMGEGCTYHEHIKLEGWTYPAQPPGTKNIVMKAINLAKFGGK